MPEVYRGRKSRGRKSGRKSGRKYSKGRKSPRKSPRYSKGRHRFRGVTYRSGDDENEFNKNYDAYDDFADLYDLPEDNVSATVSPGDATLRPEEFELRQNTRERLDDILKNPTPLQQALIQELVDTTSSTKKRKSDTSRQMKQIEDYLPTGSEKESRLSMGEERSLRSRKSGQASSSGMPTRQ